MQSGLETAEPPAGPPAEPGPSNPCARVSNQPGADGGPSDRCSRRGGAWGGFQAVTSFLARNDSPYPLKHFQGQFPKNSPDHGVTWNPAGGYKALNDSDLRWQVITYYRNIRTIRTGNRPPPRFILKASQPAPPPAPPKGPPPVLTPRPPPLPPPAHLFPSAAEQPASARSEARTFSEAPWRSTK